jgi:protoheme IX farnesyltransferase
MAEFRSVLKTYYWLTKPGIVYGNAIAAVAGFALASRGHVDLALLLAMLAGLSLVIAAGCVVNNYFDKDIDARMARTRRRPLVQHRLSGRAALTFGAGLLAAGLAVLGLFTNLLTAALALGGFVAYAGVYTYAKRKTVYSTIIGSVSGAVPPVVGYTAVTGRLDLGALLIFLFLALWQMPHFYAIGIMRLSDYRAAHLPIWPVERGIPATQRQILIFIVAFLVPTLALAALGYTNWTFALVALALVARWLWLARAGFSAPDNTVWARSMFKYSLAVLVVLCVWMSLGAGHL